MTATGREYGPNSPGSGQKQAVPRNWEVAATLAAAVVMVVPRRPPDSAQYDPAPHPPGSSSSVRRPSYEQPGRCRGAGDQMSRSAHPGVCNSGTLAAVRRSVPCACGTDCRRGRGGGVFGGSLWPRPSRRPPHRPCWAARKPGVRALGGCLDGNRSRSLGPFGRLGLLGGDGLAWGKGEAREESVVRDGRVAARWYDEVALQF